DLTTKNPIRGPSGFAYGTLTGLLRPQSRVHQAFIQVILIWPIPTPLDVPVKSSRTRSNLYAARPTMSPNKLLWFFCPLWTIRFMTSARTYWIIPITSRNLFRLGHFAILVPPD
ncbi:hypothetical protein IGI04_036074, partial [Brassica rapa subsp. trilocularis]